MIDIMLSTESTGYQIGAYVGGICPGGPIKECIYLKML
jgi:hypothetical protein